MRIVKPGGNRMISPRSHRMRCPPRSGLKLPKAVMAHHAQARLLKSRWGKLMATGPKFTVAPVNTEVPREKLRGMERWALCLQKFQSWSPAPIAQEDL